MAFLFAMIAGTFEIGWAISLKLFSVAEGWAKAWPLAGYAFFGLGSAVFLSKSMQTLPLATAYAVWIGVGAMGVSLVDIFYYQQSSSPMKVISIILIIVGVLGLKVSTGK